MIKIIDIDDLFDKYISEYVYKNIGKIKPEEIENKMPVMYEEFGDKPLKELDGKTPNTFYRDYSPNELIDCLNEHLTKGVPVSDFLCEALRDSGEKEIAERLKKDNPEELTLYLMNMLADLNSPLAVDRYLDFVLYDYPESVSELGCELLYNFADKVKDRIIKEYELASPNVKECLDDILSHATTDDKVFKILTDGFINNNKISLYAGFLAKLGDERALPLLYGAIENDKIDYADFEELRFAIEALGGEYDKKRDFSSDAVMKKIKSNKNTKIF